MKISVFGMGYVGIVSSACLAQDGHYVVGVDPNQVKVDIVNSARTPIMEESMSEMVETAVAANLLCATTDAQHAVKETEVSFVCVGTPSRSNGDLDLTHVQNVCQDIGNALKSKSDYHVVVMRSTMLPGTMRELVIPVLEKTSGKRAGDDFGICHNPEFLREGSAVYDYYNPPKTVIGELDKTAGDRLVTLYEKLSAPMIRTSLEISEMVKYVDNIWHAVKVGFGNEIGRVCKSLSVDSHAVMDIFLQDRKLNISEAYLKPGFAYGGSCLPKDLRALTYMAHRADVDIPLLDSLQQSNDQQVDIAVDMIKRVGSKKVGLMGLSFKAGTDDLRESPLVELVEKLIGKGYDLRIFDRNVNLARLVGANRDYILGHIPHIADLFVDTTDEVLSHADIMVIGNRSQEFASAVNFNDGKHVIDLVRLFGSKVSDDNYQGISW